MLKMVIDLKAIADTDTWLVSFLMRKNNLNSHLIWNITSNTIFITFNLFILWKYSYIFLGYLFLVDSYLNMNFKSHTFTLTFTQWHYLLINEVECILKYQMLSFHCQFCGIFQGSWNISRICWPAIPLCNIRAKNIKKKTQNFFRWNDKCSEGRLIFNNLPTKKKKLSFFFVGLLFNFNKHQKLWI